MCIPRYAACDCYARAQPLAAPWLCHRRASLLSAPLLPGPLNLLEQCWEAWRGEANHTASGTSITTTSAGALNCTRYANLIHLKPAYRARLHALLDCAPLLSLLLPATDLRPARHLLIHFRFIINRSDNRVLFAPLLLSLPASQAVHHFFGPG
jgi:hypothetical protein